MNLVATVKAIVLLGADGRRFIAKYCDDELAARSKQFEKQLFSRTKTPKSKDGLLVLNGLVVVHKFVKDSHIYVVGGKDENPCLLATILNCLTEVISSQDVFHPEYRSRVLSAVVEETVDRIGVMFEPDSQLVLDRIESQGHDESQHSIRRFIGM
uniref:Coatomer subunit zeta n=1 Tax=Aceria tosichella TaxID=561515 RepID=A0A6G1S4G7_9ACAR